MLLFRELPGFPAAVLQARATELACTELMLSWVKYLIFVLANTCVSKHVSADQLILAFSLYVLTASRIREL